jgi:hypothetical protein
VPLCGWGRRTAALGGHRQLEARSDSIRCCSRSTTAAIPGAAKITPGRSIPGPAQRRCAVRAASCYGVRQVWFSGDRVRLDDARRQRPPREERMRGSKRTVLYDRHARRVHDGMELPHSTAGDCDEPDHTDAVGVSWGG